MNTKQSRPVWFLHLLVVITILASGVGVISVSALDTFPSTGVLDNFNRANGAIGSSWSGYTTAFSIASNQLDVTAAGFDTYTFWNSSSFGADQEAYFTFSQLDLDSPEQSLLLKSQNSNSYGNGVIEVLYDVNANIVQVWTFHPTNGWAQRGGSIPVVFNAGDQFGARASASGMLDVYKNGTLVGSRDISTWPFSSGGGYIGMWLVDATDTLVDDFGGGNVSAAPTNTPIPSTPTNTSVPLTSTNTPIPSTSTNTPAFTATSAFTSTPSNTPLPPTETFTPTATVTSGPTNTSLPPTATNTPFVSSGIYRVATGGSSVASCGTSWANPCSLQYALQTFTTGNSEFWVRSGTYTPGTSRDSTFQVRNGQAIYGGFTGTETLRSQRNANPATNGTVLNGDIGTTGVASDNVYNVVTISGGLSGTYILDGFTITGGNSNGGSGHGGGMFIQDSRPTLSNLIISNNTASANGGGVYVLSLGTQRVNYSSPTFTNVTISNNTAARGGGLYTQNSSPVLIDSTFSGNTATGGAGGGMNNQVLNEVTDEYSIPLLTNVTFSGNTANGGGGLFNNHSYPQLTNVTFSGNTALIRGGAILNEGANPVLRNVTITGNTAPAGLGGAIRNIQNAVFAPSNPQIYNSILWGDGSEEITSDGTGSTLIVDSVVQGGFAGTNVITANPNLGGLANNGGFTQTHALNAGSSAIDTGGVNSTCASVDQRGVTRPQGSACDIGAYEYNGTVPSTPTPAPTSTFTVTPQPPTATATTAPSQTFTPTNTATFTPTPTNTPVPPTVTNTPVPPTATNTPLPGANDVMYLSSTTNGTAGGVSFNDEDILSYNRATNTWAMYFDGSDVGISGDVNAFTRMSDGSLLLSLDAATTVGSLGTVDDSDVIRFTPTSLGTNTAGSFTMYFDGSDVGLSTNDEDIDSIGLAPDGRLIFSTIGAVSVTGASGSGEDLLAFTATSLGTNTAGTWAVYFDGSDVGLSTSSSEWINGVWIDPGNNKLYLTTAGAFSVTGVSGDGADVFVCTPGTLGSTTSCTFSTYWDGSINGFSGEVVDGVSIQR